MSKAKVIPLTQDAAVFKDRQQIFVRASRLVISPYNVRKSDHSEEHKETLAASIKDKGLLRALLVHVIAGTESDPMYGIVGGKGRNGGIQMLLSRGEIDDERDLIPCVPVDESEAIAISLADNIQNPLHPADQYEAFRAMIEQGIPLEHAAISFNLSMVTAKRLLRLADVHPELLNQYRSDEIDIDQLSALAMSTDQALQLEVWNSAEHWQRQPHHLRAAIIGEKLDASRDPRVKYIGLDTYRAAGGAMEQDLFSQDGASGFILDVPLLDRLAFERLQAQAEALRSEGWGWIEARIAFSNSDSQLFGKLQEVKRDATTDEAARMAAIEAELSGIYTNDDGISDAESARIDVLEAEAEALEGGLYSFAPSAVQHGGVVVSISSSGELAIARGLVRKEDARAASKATATTGETDIESSVESAQKSKAELSDRLLQRITAHQTLAVQSQLVAQPDIALALTVAKLAERLFPTADYCSLDLDISAREVNLATFADNLADNPARLLLDTQAKAWSERLPKNTKARLNWLCDQSRDVLVELLAYCIASTYSCVRTDKARAEQDLLFNRLGIDMADYWTPTVSNYFNFVNKRQILDTVREAVKPAGAAVQALQDLKVTLMRTAAQERLEGLRWLPKVLRRKSQAAMAEKPLTARKVKVKKPAAKK